MLGAPGGATVRPMPPLHCFTAAATELYKRGLPHLVELVDDHPANAKPAAAVAKVFKDYFGAYAVYWPRAVARGFVRAACIDFELESPESLTAAARIDEIERDEAERMIRTMLTTPTRVDDFKHEQWLMCLEALIGTDTALELVAGELVALPADRQYPSEDEVVPLEDAVPGYFGYLTGYLQLRASVATATAMRDRLEALWQQTVDGGGSLDEHSLRAGLDLALHGIDGARRILTTSHWQYLNVWGFVDDAEMLRERFEARSKADWDPDPRHAWLGGDPVLPHLCAKGKVHGLGKRRHAFFEQMGLIDHPVVEAMMAAWSSDKRAGEYATRWLTEHGKAVPKLKPPAKPKAKPAPKSKPRKR